MGVPNHGLYKPTPHCIQRYRERYDEDCPSQKVGKSLRTIMMDAEFYDKAEGGAMRYINREVDLIIVINPSNYNIVTCYRASQIKGQSDGGAALLAEYSPEVRKAVSDTASKKRNTLIRQTSAELAKLYQQQAELAEKVARTKRSGLIIEYYRELKRTKMSIMEIESERDKLVHEYTSLI